MLVCRANWKKIVWKKKKKEKKGSSAVNGVLSLSYLKGDFQRRRKVDSWALTSKGRGSSLDHGKTHIILGYDSSATFWMST